MHSELTQFIISQSDGRPMYLQIMEQIRQRVAVGEWVPGDEIPSIRQLAAAIQVSVITTIKRAYLELEREGVIVTQHGKGSFVAPNLDLTPRIYDEELTEHLDQAARLGALLSLSDDELAERLHEATNRLAEAQTAETTETIRETV